MDGRTGIRASTLCSGAALPLFFFQWHGFWETCSQSGGQKDGNFCGDIMFKMKQQDTSCLQNLCLFSSDIHNICIYFIYYISYIMNYILYIILWIYIYILDIILNYNYFIFYSIIFYYIILYYSLLYYILSTIYYILYIVYYICTYHYSNIIVIKLIMITLDHLTGIYSHPKGPPADAIR